MKLATWRWGDTVEIGCVHPDRDEVVALQATHEAALGVQTPAFASMQSLIEAGPDALDLARRLDAWPDKSALRALSEVALLAPLPVPTQYRDFMTFEAHFRDCLVQIEKLFGRSRPFPQVWYEQPIYYKGNRFAFSGPETTVEWPHYATMMDYECELAVVIGSKGKDISKEAARDHVFGFTILNDYSARDAQIAEAAGGLGPAKGKDFDTANVLGPWIVTTDEIGDPHHLDMIVRRNGVEVSRGSSSRMHHSFWDMIAHVSKSETLYPGELLGSGTVGGGCGMERGEFLAAGDEIELEIENIGVLRSRLGPKN